MKRIYVATKVRGFLLKLFTLNSDKFEFIYTKEKIYETNSIVKITLSKLVKSKIADYFAIISRTKVDSAPFDYAFSYNRFLKSKVDYVIYLENPLALVHYSTDRPKTLIGKLKLQRYFSDPKLKEIICLSKACYETVDKIYSIPSNLIISQIYPLIPDYKNVNLEIIKQKSHREIITCTYISSNFNLKGGAEIIEVFNKIFKLNITNIQLTIVTKLSNIDNKTMTKIKEIPIVKIIDFKLNDKELRDLYISTNILLNPTRQDSFSLVTLEAMKAGNVILSTDLYALNELVENNKNGFLIEPKFRFFLKNNMPNEYVWNNRKKTIYSNYIDENIVNFLFKHITSLQKNRNQLEKLSINSYIKSAQGEFSTSYIKSKWNRVFEGGNTKNG